MEDIFYSDDLRIRICITNELERDFMEFFTWRVDAVCGCSFHFEARASAQIHALLLRGTVSSIVSLGLLSFSL